MSNRRCIHSSVLLMLLAGACDGGEGAPSSSSERAKIRVTPTSGLVTAEAGGAVEFTVGLTEAPRAPVSVRVFSDDESEGTVDVSELVFTRDDWGPRVVRVTGVDDAVQDGNALYHVVLDEAVSDDLRFQSVPASDVTLTNVDDDTPGVTVSYTEGVYTSERGGTALLSVRLNSRPTGIVVVPVSSSDPAEGEVSTNLLTFYPRSWDVPQELILTGVDDDETDGNQVYLARFAPVQSSDLDYLGLDPDDVEILSVDDEWSPVSMAWSDDTPLTEGDGSNRVIYVSLLAAPTADVEITAGTSLDGVELSEPLRFTVDNWQSEQEFYVSAGDNMLEHDQVAHIEFTITSADATFATAYAPTLDLTILDDDVGKLSLSSTSEQTCELGISECCTTVFVQTNYTLTLPLTLAISVDSSEASTTATSLVLEAGGPNSFEVCGVDDGERDGDKSYEVQVSVDATDDPFWSAALPAVLTLTNLDDGATASDWPEIEP